MPSARTTIGWDIGGAHVKACRVENGRVQDIAQWPCPLWQGLPHLDAVLAQARLRWADLATSGPAPRHVATMTGEMVDLFTDREQGVVGLSAHLAEALGPSLKLYAGQGLGDGDGELGPRTRWVSPHRSGRHWAVVASANWRATAEWLAACMPEALLVDIGSTTTDLIPVHAGRVATRGGSDAQRLASGELVYQGVVRTPLCALTQQLHFRGEATGVMNEWFATTADVYRLLGQLTPAHDQQPSADQADKSLPATRQRLARMVGRDARDGTDDDWRILALQWRGAQVASIGVALRRVAAAGELALDAPLVAAGCGEFLVASLAESVQRPSRRFADTLPWPGAAAADRLAAWAQVCAPAVAVALLADADADAGESPARATAARHLQGLAEPKR